MTVRGSQSEWGQLAEDSQRETASGGQSGETVIEGQPAEDSQGRTGRGGQSAEDSQGRTVRGGQPAKDGQGRTVSVGQSAEESQGRTVRGGQSAKDCLNVKTIFKESNVVENYISRALLQCYMENDVARRKSPY
jgi:hypothetical protein